MPYRSSRTVRGCGNQRMRRSDQYFWARTAATCCVSSGALITRTLSKRWPAILTEMKGLVVLHCTRSAPRLPSRKYSWWSRTTSQKVDQCSSLSVLRVRTSRVFSLLNCSHPCRSSACRRWHELRRKTTATAQSCPCRFLKCDVSSSPESEYF